ncbi:MAG: D-alanyl-D-alanine carboxypeptidase family protein [Thermoleophilia bacterium]|nr:D-alanyl-D-alanine carboxypeptidase family protein [Thermoleophilia bacterium]
MKFSPKNRLITAILFIVSLLLLLTPIAAAQEAPVPPEVAAGSAVMINADTGQVLYSLNPDEPRAMASTTKMMTALLVMENCKDLNARVTASQRAAEVGEASIFLQAGESLTVREMLNGMLIQSGNDAATALAEYQGGTVEAFAGMMNKKAAELGMTNTHFTNPHGLDDPGHYTTATDFARLGRELMKYPEIREIVKRSEYTIPWPGQPWPRSLVNHNHMLDVYPFINGIKTGYTDAAGQCIVISASENGVNLIISYLGGPSLGQRDADVVNLARFGFASYTQKTVIARGAEYASAEVPFYYNKQLPLVAAEDLNRTCYVKDSVEKKVVLPDELQLPVHKGDKIGLIEVYENGKYLGSSYLLAAEDISEPGMGERVTYYVQSAFGFLLSAVKPG